MSMSKPTRLAAVGRAIDIITAVLEAGEHFFDGHEQPFWSDNGYKDEDVLTVLKNIHSTLQGE